MKNLKNKINNRKHIDNLKEHFFEMFKLHFELNIIWKKLEFMHLKQVTMPFFMQDRRKQTKDTNVYRYVIAGISSASHRSLADFRCCKLDK